MSALLPSGKPPTTLVRRRISRSGRPNHVVRADPPPMLDGIVVEQVGRGLADAFPEAGGGGLQPLGLHFGGDLFGLLQRGLSAFHGEHGLQGGRGPCRVLVADLGQDDAHEADHAPLVARVRQHRVHGGDEPGAPVADHEPHAPETAFDHAPDELLPAGLVLLHALRDADDLTAAGVVHADRDQHAHVLDRPAPRAPVAARRPRTGTGTNGPPGDGSAIDRCPRTRA